ncbi:NADH:flavin oxidoreductase/NADH oxidase domain-containing protein [Tieghemostelium lacteum]|uniref:NADH:flavin oxidoreductase/NADH oxidase domain-containing protein n=1 Tax=Tieghemostelium lacteum TaxID=361077 RepID=A0A152A2C0_TIELA|nr:NADH:flavin oxidoreductase/NADH oxidase domain-containing protein [Tieghemostelium lacteum]|eukprot:KYR00359.1 NADH:flavin oxidoreductase/NADH oxidase domain-containing protein [Tieghemostelium lacteum]
MNKFDYGFLREEEIPKYYQGPGVPVFTERNTEEKYSNLPKLFTPIKIKDMDLKNRIVVSPMCQYSSVDGLFNEWHLVHYGTLARSGAALIVLEATAVVPEGRITYGDSGLWNDSQIEPMKRVIDFCKLFNCKIALQLAHSGRKGSTNPIYIEGAIRGAPAIGVGREYDIYGPSEVQWGMESKKPHELSLDDIKCIINAFKDTTIRAIKAGVDMIEIHGAHGYLINSFLSSTSNIRTDQYGGIFENRIRFLTDIITAVKTVWPKEKPLSVRLSCEEWVENGWNIEETINLVKVIRDMGVDLVDCSSGGNSCCQNIPNTPMFQIPLSETIKKECIGQKTMAVGGVTDGKTAEDILQNLQADLICVARQFLKDPFWPQRAADELGIHIDPVLQYSLAHRHKKTGIPIGAPIVPKPNP